MTPNHGCGMKHCTLTNLLPLAGILSFFCLSIAQAGPLEVGADAPKVSSLDQDGKEIDLGKVFSEGTSLVYFYPKADTPGCTKQACNLRDEFAAVTDAGIKVYGVSNDTPEDQKAFAEKFDLPFTLIADKKGEVIKAFGVPANPRGFAARQSFLVRDGKVIWRDLKAAPATQAKDAIAAAKGEKSTGKEHDENHEIIEKVMKKGLKGKTSLLAKALEGSASAEEIRKLAELVATLKGTKAPIGDPAAYENKVAVLIKAMNKVAAGDKSSGALKELKKASNCKACHKDHKPK